MQPRTTNCYLGQLPWPSVFSSRQARISNLYTHILRAHSSRPRVQHRSTAVLDGLRGVAAFIVMTYHWLSLYYHMNCGWMPGTEHAVWWNLPGIKIFFAGPPMVAVFFGISGYALSYKPLKQLRSQSWATLHHTLSSYTLRRAIRLYLPTFLSLFTVALIGQMGFYDRARAHKDELLNGGLFSLPPRPALKEQLWDCTVAAMRLANIWSWEVYRPWELDTHLWTIGVEMRASAVLFLTLLGLAKVRSFSARVTLAVAIGAWAMLGQRWDVVLFIGGMVLADVDLEARKRVSMSALATDPAHNLTWGIIFLVGVYFCSAPGVQMESAMGYKTVARISSRIYHHDPAWFPHGMGGLILVSCATRAAFCQWILTTDVALYLGDISFSLYLVHGPLLRWLGYVLVPKLWTWTGKSPSGYAVGVWASYIVFAPFAIYLAGFHRTLVDQPSIEFAKWVESKLILDS